MIIIPLVPAAASGALSLAIVHGARLVEAGPIAGSYFVVGNRADLVLPLMRQGILTLGTSFGGCGSGQARPAGSTKKVAA